MRVAEGADDQVGRHRFADDDDQHGRQHVQRVFPQHRRVEQHADGDEEQHREGVAQRQRLLGGALAERAFAQHHAGEEGAQREGGIEQLGGGEGHAQRDGIDGQAKQLTRAGVGCVVHHPGDDAPAAHQHERDEGGDLGERDGHRQADLAGRGTAGAGGGGDGGQQHQGDDHHQILHHQPTDRDAAAIGVQDAALLQGADEDDGAGDGEGEAEDEPRGPAPAQHQGQCAAQDGGDCDLTDGAGNGDLRDGGEVFQREMQADAEHEEDDADLSQLLRQGLVGDEAGGEGADDDAGDEIADEGLDADAVGQEAEDVGKDEAHRDGGDEGGLMVGHGRRLAEEWWVRLRCRLASWDRSSSPSRPSLAPPWTNWS